MARERIEWCSLSLLLLCSASLFAQAPSTESFHAGELTKIDRIADGSYEYTIYNGVDDAFTGATMVAIRVRQGAEVEYTIRNGSIYIIDDDGKIQETRYIRQAEVRRITISEKDLRKLQGEPVPSEIPRVLDRKAPNPAAVPASEQKPDPIKAESKKKAKAKPEGSH